MTNDFENIIIKVLQGSEDKELLDKFTVWYNESDDNKLLFLQLKDIYDRRRGGIYPEESYVYETWNRLNKTVRSRKSSKRSLNLIILGASVAAIAIVLMVLGIGVLNKNNGYIEWIEVSTFPRSAPKTINLPDGSTVIMNASSYLSYPEKFTSNKKEVFLDGEAYFKVINDNKSEFVVHTTRQSINVLGTEFNVLGYSSNHITITTLVNGKIELETFDEHDRIVDKVVMRPNDQIKFDREVNETNVSKVDIAEVKAWINGVYSFRETSIEEITQRMGKVIGATFIVPDEEIRNEEYTGKLFYNQTFEEIIEVLNFNDQFKFEIDNDTIYIFSNKTNMPM